MRIRRATGVILAALLLVFAMAPASAHAEDDYLIGSDPQPHQELNETPGWVTLAFRTKANAKLAKILVLNSAGKNVTTGALIVEGTNVTSQLEFDLPQDTYSVYYRTSDGKGEPRGGAFQFAYGKGNWTQLDKEVWVGEKEQPPIMTNPDPNDTEPGTPGGTASASVSPSAAPTDPTAQPSGSAAPTGGASTAGQPSSGQSGPAWWLIGAGVVVAGLLAWAVVVFTRRGRGGGGTDATGGDTES